MNRVRGHIADIKVNGSLSLVAVDIDAKVVLKSIVIETPETVSYLTIGNKVEVLFKETEVVIGTQADHAISLQNRIHGTITKIERGELISRVVLDTHVGELVSIISTDAVDSLGLKERSMVIAMIKLNEIMLAE
ncbi:MAG TPA: TOBE domain-containing protein [Eudoraea sp.]|nr:TOBE domain-containing protein [Eudoraea sp.]